MHVKNSNFTHYFDFSGLNTKSITIKPSQFIVDFLFVIKSQPSMFYYHYFAQIHEKINFLYSFQLFFVKM